MQSVPELTAQSNPVHRFLFADILRCAGTVAVIIIHASYQLFYMQNDIALDRWLAVNFWESCSRWAVPVFFMLSGMLLLNSSGKNVIQTILLKRVPRLILPLVAWSQIYLFWINRENILSHKSFSFSEGFRWMYQGGVYLHLWFLYTLIGIYLSIPVLNILSAHAGRNMKLYIILGWLGIHGFIGFIGSFYELKMGIDVPMFSLYMGYFLIGFWLKEYKLNVLERRIAVVITLACIALTFLGTFYLKEHAMKMENFYEYSSPTVMISAVGLFIIARNINFSKIFTANGWLAVIIKEISSLTFGVYLSHVLVLEVLALGIFTKPITANSIHPLIGIPLLSLFVFIVCLAFTKLVRYIPVLRWLVP